MEQRMEIAGIYHGCDKVYQHKYHLLYGIFLDSITEKEGAMIEIGIDKKESLNVWLDIFPNFYIYGADIKLEDKGERHTIFKLDQSKEADLDLLVANCRKDPVWLIIDDGSHIPEHQLLTFNKLFPLLMNGGIYIIEDVEVSYWRCGSLYGYETHYGYNHPKSIVRLFRKIAECVNRMCIDNFENHGHIQHLDMIASITFAKNCIIIRKQDAVQPEPYKYTEFLRP